LADQKGGMGSDVPLPYALQKKKGALRSKGMPARGHEVYALEGEKYSLFKEGPRETFHLFEEGNARRKHESLQKKKGIQSASLKGGKPKQEISSRENRREERIPAKGIAACQKRKSLRFEKTETVKEETCSFSKGITRGDTFGSKKIVSGGGRDARKKTPS